MTVQALWIFIRKLPEPSITGIQSVNATLHRSGGVEVLEDVAGQDATEAYHDVGHSEEADQTLSSYYIGELKQDVSRPLDDETQQQNLTLRKSRTPSNPATKVHRSSSSWSQTLVYALIPVAIAGVISYLKLTV